MTDFPAPCEIAIILYTEVSESYRFGAESPRTSHPKECPRDHLRSGVNHHVAKKRM